ncbi:MAG: PAS domain S-box protein, partial [Actinobacteria bacterium]|nr:PAS domain S-box protein [Actinomycetota bacterium]
MEERGESLDLESLREELSQARALNKELEAIFESSYDEIYVTDGQGVTLRVNAACERLYGIKAGELIGKHVRELEKQGIFSPSISPMVMKERKQLTILQTTRTGRKIVVTSTPIFDEDGALIRIVHNSRDITELLTLKKQLEDAEELSRRYSMELEELRLEKTNPENILAVGPKMRGILELGRKLARVDSTVLILGESGVGKNMLA